MIKHCPGCLFEEQTAPNQKFCPWCDTILIKGPRHGEYNVLIPIDQELNNLVRGITRKTGRQALQELKNACKLYRIILELELVDGQDNSDNSHL